jgi:hypothetical protein
MQKFLAIVKKYLIIPLSLREIDMKTKITWAIKSLVFLLICAGTPGLAMATNSIVVNDTKTETQQWAADSEIDEVTFENKGAVKITTGEKRTAIEISKESPTIIFANDPALETAVPVDREAPDGEKVRAHIYANNEADGQCAVAIDLSPGVHLTVGAAKRPVAGNGSAPVCYYVPVIAARSSVNGKGVAVAIRAGTGDTPNEISFLEPVRLYASSSTSPFPPSTFPYNNYSNGSAVVGAGVGYDASKVSGSAITASFRDHNALTASSYSYYHSNSTTSTTFYSYSGSAVVGAGVGYAYGVSGSNITAFFGDHNTLTASSSAASPRSYRSTTTYSYSGSAVVGAGVGYDAYGVSGSNITASFGDHNTLTASSRSSSTSSSRSSSLYSYSGSALVGAALGDGSESEVSGSNITASFGDHNTLSASSSSSTSYSSYSSRCYSLLSYSGSAVVGAGVGYAYGVSGSNITASFGDHNTLTASSSSSPHYTTDTSSGIIDISYPSRSSSLYSYSGSAVVGAGVGSGRKVSGSNITASFGDHNTLSASSSSSPSSPSLSTSYSYSGSAVVGAGVGSGSGVSGSNISASFGDHNTLTASSSSPSSTTSSTSYSYSGSAVMGTAAGRADGGVSAVGIAAIFGNDNRLSATSSSDWSGSSSGSAIVGAAVGDGGDEFKVSASAITASFGDRNILTASSSSHSSSSGSALVGAAVGDGYSVAHSVAVNFSGTQVLGALAHTGSGPDGAKVNTFGADNTDRGESAFGFRVGIYASGEDILGEGAESESGSSSGQKVLAKKINHGSTVNILAAKLAEKWTIDGPSSATIALSSNQGANRNTYARAFALGEDFQIYVGGRVEWEKDTYGTPPNYGFTVVPANGYSNVMNVFGAIAPARDTKVYVDLAAEKGVSCNRVRDSRLTVDSGWEMNVYGPIEGLQSIDVKDGTLHTYGSLRNITVDGGTVSAYGRSDNVGTLHLRSGELRLGACTDNGAAERLKFFAGQLTIADDNGVLHPVAFGDNSAYLANFGKEGQLVLNKGDTVMFNFNSKVSDFEVTNVKEGSDESFAHVKGFISVEGGQRTSPAIAFKGGQFKFYDEGTGQEQVPTGTNLLLVRCAGLKIGKVFADYGNTFGQKRILEDGTVVWEALENLNEANFPYDKENVDKNLKLRYFDGIGFALCGDNAIPSLSSFVGGGFLLDADANDDSTQSCASGELASIVVSSVNLFRSAISSRLTDVKGNGNDPFILGVAGHTHRGQVNDFAYDSDLYGLAGGLDHLFKLNNGDYWRAGAAISYVSGDTVFSGKGSGKEKSTEQGLYSLALFAAYEGFDAKKLKMDINLCAGLGYGNDKLFRIDNDGNVFDSKMKSHNGFISLEGIKNLAACNDVQVGLWLRADYNHIREGGYDEKTSSTAIDRCGHISSTSFNFLNTIVGVNVESEIGSAPANEGEQFATAGSSSLRLYMRAGWNWQPVRKHSKASAYVGALTNNTFTPTVGLASRHGAVIEAGFREKLNVHWDIVGQWTAFFSKNQTDSLFSLGVGYNF